MEFSTIFTSIYWGYNWTMPGLSPSEQSLVSRERDRVSTAELFPSSFVRKIHLRFRNYAFPNKSEMEISSFSQTFQITAKRERGKKLFFLPLEIEAWLKERAGGEQGFASSQTSSARVPLPRLWYQQILAPQPGILHYRNCLWGFPERWSHCTAKLSDRSNWKPAASMPQSSVSSPSFTY